MKRRLIQIASALAFIYLAILVLLYVAQEAVIFHPQKLLKDYSFTFNQEFEEMNFEMPDEVRLNGLLFKADQPKGLIFYLHGNAGSLAGWGEVAKTYTELNYDVFILDYRGYGKSDGVISSEEQLHADHQIIYDAFMQQYDESQIVVLGYSIGTGFAAKLAANNQPTQLILQAPYYSLTDMMDQNFSWVPSFVLKYKLATYRSLMQCEMPIHIFHGTEDRVIPYHSSRKLIEAQPKATLYSLEGQGHNGMSYNHEYLKLLPRILK